MSEHYQMPYSEDALVELVDRAESEIEKWEKIKRIAMGNLACMSED